MRHRSFVLGLHHPRRIAAHETVMTVSHWSLIFTSLQSKTVTYPALANLTVLMSEVLLMPGVMRMSQAGLLTAADRWLMSIAGSVAPLGSLKILSDFWPVLIKCLLSSCVPTLDVAPLLAAAEVNH